MSSRSPGRARRPMAADDPRQRVFTVEAPGLTSGQVAAILERAIADGVYEIPQRRGSRDRITVGPIRGGLQGRALAGSIVTWRGAQAGMWWPGLASPDLSIEGTLRDTDVGSELRIVLRPGSNRQTMLVGLALAVMIGGAAMLSDPDPVVVFVAMASWLFGLLLAGVMLAHRGEQSLERSVDVHRFLTRVVRAGAAGEPGWREATWR
jgi:hypothetical protein